MPIVSRSKYAWLVVALALINSPQLGAREKFPQVSEDGLQLQEHTKLRAVWLGTIAWPYSIAMSPSGKTGNGTTTMRQWA